MTNRAKWLFPVKKKKKKAFCLSSSRTEWGLSSAKELHKVRPSSKGELKPKPSPLPTRDEALVQPQVTPLPLGSLQRITRIIPTGHVASLGMRRAQGSPWPQAVHRGSRARLLLLSLKPRKTKHSQVQVQPCKNIFGCLDLSFCYSRKVPRRIN